MQWRIAFGIVHMCACIAPYMYTYERVPYIVCAHRARAQKCWLTSQVDLYSKRWSRGEPEGGAPIGVLELLGFLKGVFKNFCAPTGPEGC